MIILDQGRTRQRMVILRVQEKKKLTGVCAMTHNNMDLPQI